MTTTYQKLHKLITAAVPSILELKFGCQVKISGINQPCVITQSVGNGNYQLSFYRDGCAATIVFGDEYLQTKEIILGRPIRLDDIAKLEKVDKHWLVDNWKHGYLIDQTEEFLKELYEQVS